MGMYRQELGRLDSDLGTAAARQRELWSTCPPAGDFYERLCTECAGKVGNARPIGFLG